MRFKNFAITEAVKLTPEQLAKNNSKTGEARIDILIRLIQDQVPLELAKGGTFKVGEDHIDDAIAHCQNFKKNETKRNQNIMSSSRNTSDSWVKKATGGLSPGSMAPLSSAVNVAASAYGVGFGSFFLSLSLALFEML